MEYFRVTNFEKYQHYKTGKRAFGPPLWIKLYGQITHDIEFTSLPDATKYHLLGIYILASRYDNRIPFEPDFIALQVGANSLPVDLERLISDGFIEMIENNNNALDGASRNASKNASTEKKREREREEERDRHSSKNASNSDSTPDQQLYDELTAEAPEPTAQDLTTGTSPAFRLFYNLYPKKTGVTAAWRAWQTIFATHDIEVQMIGRVREIILGVKGLRENLWDEWSDAEKIYSPAQAKFLDGGHWADEVPATKAKETRPANQRPPKPEDDPDLVGSEAWKEANPDLVAGNRGGEQG